MKFSIALPTVLWPDGSTDQNQAIRSFARAVEERDFEGLWVTEHLLTGAGMYASSRLEPMTLLAFLSAITDRLRLGTSILVLPLRHPVVLAKELATLMRLSNERIEIGVGPGWDHAEFEAVQIPMAERGARTDEALEILRRLFTEREVDFAGRFYQFKGVSIDPLPAQRPRFWIGGGSQLADPRSPNPPRMAPTVARRIARSDGWLARPTVGIDQLEGDWEIVKRTVRELGRTESDIEFCYKCYLHVVTDRDPAKARDQQRAPFERVMGMSRGPEYWERVYLLGTVDEMVGRLRRVAAMGAQHIMFSPVSEDPQQVELIANELVPALAR